MTPAGDTLRFPEGFVWGAGLSAHQAEGGNRANDWWRFEAEGKVASGERSGDACDHYRRFREDFALARELGHSAHKLSVEWARIEPEPGVFDEAELAHYSEVVSTLRGLGVEPFVTLHHFTNPLWFADAGGWEDPASPERFAAYVRRVATELAGSVHYWVTLNEPMLVAGQGYVRGLWPPERRDVRAAFRVAANLARAHALAHDALREACPGCPVGVAVNTAVYVREADPQPADAMLLRALDRYTNHWFLDKVSGSCDFVGVQYYTRFTVGQVVRDALDARPADRRPLESDIGWEVYPEGLRQVVSRTWRRYGLPIYVTENGLADAADRVRERFIVEHLAELHRSITEGADVRGYLHWSLLDNFEWREGFGPRFGLVEVDYATQERKVRPSALVYRDICSSNASPAPSPRE